MDYRQRQDEQVIRQARMQIAYCEARMEEEHKAHSPLGASGAERWMNCAGSVALIKALDLPESDEPDYRREGTALHEAAAHCLDNHLDAWEVVGQVFNETLIDQAMGQAVQVYLDYCAPFMGENWDWAAELRLSSSAHQDMYGTADFSAVQRHGDGRVKVVDLKGGEGILVEAYDNPQLKYYAFMVLERHGEWPDETPVDIAIVQPRIMWTDSPVREWSTTVGEIKAWVAETLVPAMLATEVDSTLDAGEWCRFCPAKLVCPLMTDLFGAAATSDPKRVVNLTNDLLGINYQHVQAVKFYLKALEEETYRRLNLGQEVAGTKLVPKRAIRVFPASAQTLAKERFGEDALNPAELKSPAQLEKVSPAAAAFVKEHAYTPDTGTTVALASDPKPGVVIRSTNEAFATALTALKE